MSLIVLTLNSSLRPRKYEMVVRTAMRTSWVGRGKLQNFLALTERIESQKTRNVMQAQEIASVIRLVFTIFSPTMDIITRLLNKVKATIPSPRYVMMMRPGPEAPGTLSKPKMCL